MGRMRQIVVSGMLALTTLSASAQPLTLEDRLSAFSERVAQWLEALMLWADGDNPSGLPIDKAGNEADPDGRRRGGGDTDGGG
jgi:hypothetical protein